MMTFASASFAQGSVAYLTIPSSVPLTGVGTQNTTPLATMLPGYGAVQVSWSAGTPYSNQTEQFSPNGPAGTYTWGPSANDLNIFTTPTIKYTITFTFLGAVPDQSRLLLAVIGLDNTTTVTAAALQPWNLVGEYAFPVLSATPPTTATTCLGNGVSAKSCPKSGTVFYSDYNRTGGDSRNTGWALFQATKSITSKTFSLQVVQDGGDGIGFTLGYVQQPILKICKVAGTGIPVGAQFSFSALSNSVTTPIGPVPAGPPPGGTCVLGPSFPLGSTVTVAETIPSGDTVANIAVNGQSVGVIGPATTPPITIIPGVNEVTFTNQVVTGYLEICKQLPNSTPPFGENFSFTVTPGNLGPIVVASNSCSPALQLPVGQYVIQESPVNQGHNFDLVTCSTIPPNQQVGSCNNPSAGSMTVKVAPGGISTQTIANFTNQRSNN
jgi:hypothetical protein